MKKENIIKRVLTELYKKDLKNDYGVPTTESDYNNSMDEVDKLLFENKLLYVCSFILGMACMYLLLCVYVNK